MFNLARFNLQRFNIRDGEILQVSATFSESFSSSTDLKREYLATATYDEVFNQETSFNRKTYITATYDEVFNSSSDVGIALLVEATYNEVFNQESRIVSNPFVTATYSESFDSKSRIVANLVVIVTFEESLNIDAILSKIVPTGDITYYDILNAVVSSENFDNEYATINVTIPVGSSLIIDSDNFNVLLDSVNVLDKYSGDWVNLDRDVISMQVISGTGTALETSMLYEEKYL